MKKIIACLLAACLLATDPAHSQKFSFAFVSDTHIGNPTAAADLKRTVRDINEDTTLRFVIISGDITEFGSDEELNEAKNILSGLEKPWYVIPGNHDTKWSESGGNSFRRVFGSETFAFSYGGFLFLGTNCGPNMRMGPGQVPREHLVWLDSSLNSMTNKRQPIIYVNHYPQDTALNNWYAAIDLLKQRNIQLILCGHGHANHTYAFEGIPAIMGRSNLRAKDSIGGYNIVRIDGNRINFQERKPLLKTMDTWTEAILEDHQFGFKQPAYFRPSYDVNVKYNNVKSIWKYQDNSDIGAALVMNDGLIIGTNTNGEVFALDQKSGRQKWVYRTGGKIYSSPAVLNRYIIVASTDKHIYCLDARSGGLIWKYETLKPIVASPLINHNRVFIGGSDGHFRSLDLFTGRLIWDYDKVQGFVETKPLYYDGKLFFGSWGNDFYAIDAETGNLSWKWNNGSTNRMFSPAACIPVGADGKVFIVAPDRYMTAFEATTGKIVWRKYLDSSWVRESLGLSEDSSLVFVKTMQGQLLGIDVKADALTIKWKADAAFGYELDPSPVVEKDGVIFVPTQSGKIYAIDRKAGSLIWVHKLSNCLVNPILVINNTEIIASTMDGIIEQLRQMR